MSEVVAAAAGAGSEVRAAAAVVSDAGGGSRPDTAPALSLIWAEAQGGVIGRDGGMPWHLPEDLRHFREATMGEPVVMGRRTWESLPERFRPLPGRLNTVVTSNPSFAAPGARIADSLNAAMVGGAEPARIWVIGGAGLFREAIERASELLVTRIDVTIEGGDTFAPEIGPEWLLEALSPWLIAESGVRYRFERYLRA